MIERKNFDLDAYIDEIQTRPCFICELIAGRTNGNRVIHQDSLASIEYNYPRDYNSD